MRATVAGFAFVAAMGSVAFASSPDNPPPTDSTPSYYLRGYYNLDNQRPTWLTSDTSPWYQVKTNTPWVNRRLVKWGYIPFTHGSNNYYCRIEKGARTGSKVIDTTFMCGDPDTVQWLFQNNWKPSVPMIGGGPPLESSLRPRP